MFGTDVVLVCVICPGGGASECYAQAVPSISGKPICLTLTPWTVALCFGIRIPRELVPFSRSRAITY